MTFHPLHDNVLLKQIKAEDKVGSLFLPDSASTADDTHRMTVLGVGPGRVTKSGYVLVPLVEVGDTVAVYKGGGLEVKVDGESLMVVPYEDLVGVIRD